MTVATTGLGTMGAAAWKDTRGIGDLRGLLPGLCNARGVSVETRCHAQHGKAVRHTVAVGRRTRLLGDSPGNREPSKQSSRCRARPAPANIEEATCA